jgi:peptidoglycan/xylan/chitin deacetylase (PgdA/CDA1 family)
MIGASRGWVKRSVVDLLGTRPVSSISRRILGNRLRVLAYHDVPDPEAFDRQLRVLTSDYTPVNGATVVRHLKGETELPADAIWVTFDDGWADVVELGLPLLLEHGVPASMFVCPGLVGTGRTHWWEAVSQACELGWALPDVEFSNVVSHLKSVPDRSRREAVEGAEAFLAAHAVPLGQDPASLEQLMRWCESGMELGNHTWDHPCLDCCSPDEQRRQILDADAWLERFGAFATVRLFAYPNGDWTQDADDALREGAYDVCLLFDHRISPAQDLDPRRISRLRVDSSAPTRRWRAIASGGHSLMYRPG